MSVNIPEHFVQQFSTNIDLLLQQKDSRLRSMVMTGSHVGKQASPVNQIGSIEMQPVTGRFGPIGRVDAPMDRRWVFPSDFDLNQMIDSFDKLKLITDPSSSYVQNAVHAANRQFDKLILSAFFGTAKTGETAATLTAFPAAQQVAVGFGSSADIGLTVAKLREGKRKLMAADVNIDSDPIFCAITARQHDNLLAEAQIISRDFNTAPVLVNGKVQSFLGINFIHTELINVDANLDERIPMWAKSGMYLGIWNDMQTDVSQRKDITSLPFQAYMLMSAGATRLEEKKTIELICDPT